jgi:hypothetical protein
MKKRMVNMKLTDAERAEFIALSEATYDAALWDEDDLPILRKARLEYEEEEARERTNVIPIDQPNMTEDDEDIDPNPHPA